MFVASMCERTIDGQIAARSVGRHDIIPICGRPAAAKIVRLVVSPQEINILIQLVKRRRHRIAIADIVGVHERHAVVCRNSWNIQSAGVGCRVRRRRRRVNVKRLRLQRSSDGKQEKCQFGFIKGSGRLRGLCKSQPTLETGRAGRAKACCLLWIESRIIRIKWIERIIERKTELPQMRHWNERP